MPVMRQSEAARRLNVSPATIRRWSTAFAVCLSESAAGGDNRSRAYTAQDLRILAHVQRLTAAGRKLEDVALELAHLQEADWRALPEATSPDDIGGAYESAGNAAIVALRHEVELRQRRVDELKQDLELMRSDYQDERAAHAVTRKEVQDAIAQEAHARGRLQEAERNRRLLLVLALALVVVGIMGAFAFLALLAPA
jgi:DNA-binding transcriptional MerR regulator